MNLTEGELNPWELGFRNPVNNKKVVLNGHIHMDQDDAEKMINNMGGQAQDDLTAATNYLIMGDHDFFNRNNEALTKASELNKEGGQIKRLSESFFLSMLDDWARS